MGAVPQIPHKHTHMQTLMQACTYTYTYTHTHTNTETLTRTYTHSFRNTCVGSFFPSVDAYGPFSFAAIAASLETEALAIDKSLGF